jgi:hypothetical protein
MALQGGNVFQNDLAMLNRAPMAVHSRRAAAGSNVFQNDVAMLDGRQLNEFGQRTNGARRQVGNRQPSNGVLLDDITMQKEAAVTRSQGTPASTVVVVSVRARACVCVCVRVCVCVCVCMCVYRLPGFRGDSAHRECRKGVGGLCLSPMCVHVSLPRVQGMWWQQFSWVIWCQDLD